MILDEILMQKRKDLNELKARYPLHRLKEAVSFGKRTSERSFKKSISQPHQLNLICEVKKASPSEGILRDDFQPLKIASIYEKAGASAISVLTEPHFFMGRPSYLRTIREVTNIPLLRKDFIFDPYQIYESAILEADALLLISSILTDEELKSLLELAAELKIDVLVEVHTEEDLKKALKAGAQIIGINNRNLQTLKVDAQMAKKLLAHIPKRIVKVIESGLSRHEELLEYQTLGADAFLIGTALMKAPDMSQMIQTILGYDRKWKQTTGGK